MAETGGESSILGTVLKIGLWVLGAIAGLILLVVLGSLIVPPLTRPATDKWGATAEETKEALPGDDLFPATREVSTKAVTIQAPPNLVYSLLVQMGQRRAGWYGWDWFYKLTKSDDFVDGHYSRRIVPELQDLKVGDTIGINDAVQYTVVQADRPIALVLVAGSIPASDLPVASPVGTWTENSMAFAVQPIGDNASRLILRMRADGSERGFARWIWNRPLNFGGALFSHKTIVGIKRVAEELAAGQAGG